MKTYALILTLIAGLSSPLWAGFEEYRFDSEKQEQQYKKLVNELRCLVCQNQNIADSNAELAQDLRAEIYSMLKQGMDDKQVVEFMVARYGDFVLYRPPFKTATLMLWIGPFLALLLGAFIFYKVVRSNKQAVTDFKPDAAEQARLQELLKKNDKEARP